MKFRPINQSRAALAASRFEVFWRQHPALLLGISLSIGSSCFLFWPSPWNSLFIILWSFYLLFLRKPIFLAALASSFFYSWILYGNAPILDSPKQISALFSISSLQTHQSPFQKGLLYKGTIYLDSGAYPCSIYHRGKQAPRAVCDYIIQGTLQQRGPYDYLLAPKEWRPVKKSWSFAEKRYQIKEHLRRFLKKKLSSRAGLFLGSLITGDVEDRLLRFEFGKLGLQHILAISGFHFAILIALCSFILSFILPRFWKYIVLMIAINAYFLFIGALPAVQRSWLTAQLYLGAKLLNRQTSGLNLLGCAMALEVSLNPLVCGHLGFQLSFLSCGGILILHPFFDRQLRSYLPKRTQDEIGALNSLSKHAYFLSSFLRQAISLTLSVNCAIFPLLLYHFHQFPFLSLFYNLFYPFFVGAVLSLLLVSLSLHFIFPPLASLLFSLANWTTSRLLDLASHPPLALDYCLLISHVPGWIIPLYLFALFSLFLKPFHPVIDE